MNRIKHYRELARLTQSDLANRVNLEQCTISHYENLRRTPDLATCRSIVSVFCDEGVNVGIDDVFPVHETTAA